MKTEINTSKRGAAKAKRHAELRRYRHRERFDIDERRNEVEAMRDLRPVWAEEIEVEVERPVLVNTVLGNLEVFA